MDTLAHELTGQNVQTTGVLMSMTRKEPVREDVAAGQKLRNARLRKGLSQIELGKFLGVTYQQIQKYEKGNTRMSVSAISLLAKALDVAPSYFFSDAEESFTPVQNKREAELLKLAKQLTTEQLTALCRIACTIIDNTPRQNAARLQAAKDAA